MSAPELSVVIPAYREEENLRVLLPRLREVLEKESLPFEALVLDTQKPLDNTAEVCAKFGVRYVPRQGGDHYGAAVMTGIREARGKWTLFMDADGSHTPEFIPRLLAHRHQFDVAIGSRYVEGGDTENPWVLIFMSRVVNVLYGIVLGLKCKDVSNSFKLYRSEQLKALPLKCENFDIVEEILLKLSRRFKVSIHEVPFTFKKRMFGESKRDLVLFVLTYLTTLIRLRLGA